MDELQLKQLYETARTVPPGEALQMVRQADSNEERNFFAYVSDMNLQRTQWKYIDDEYYMNKSIDEKEKQLKGLRLLVADMLDTLRLDCSVHQDLPERKEVYTFLFQHYQSLSKKLDDIRAKKE